MTTRHAACSCGQLHLTIEGEPSRIAMCHCLECQRRTGAVISNQARFRREQVTIAGKATDWKRTALVAACPLSTKKNGRLSNATRCNLLWAAGVFLHT
jgi:hypothetical protein